MKSGNGAEESESVKMKTSVICSFMCAILLFFLTAAAHGTDFTEHVISDALEEVKDIQILDIDGDGDIDIFSTDMDGVNSGRVTWWENLNNGEFTAYIIADELPYARGCQAIDFDDDGDIDLFVTGGEDHIDDEGNIGNVYYFENDGDQGFEQHIIFDNFPGAAEVEVGDLDDDGDLDILLSSSRHWGFGFNAGIIAWFENEGDGEFTRHDIWAGRAKSVAPLTDIDSDGDLDIFGVDISIEGDITLWFENDGDGGFEVNELPVLLGSIKSPGIIDLDRDGDVDLLISDFYSDRYGNYMYWLENSGEEEFEAHAISIGFLRGVRDFDIVDFDLDRDYDLIIAGYEEREGPDFAVLENDGEQNFEPILISNEHLRPRKTLTADVDRDGDVDIILGAEGGRLSWWEQVPEIRVFMDSGWNMVSLHIDPIEPDVIRIFTALVERESVLLVKDGFGRFYSPADNFNNIPSWNFREGYLVKMSEEDSLVIAGEEVAPDTPIPLLEGWNMIAYFPEDEIEAPAAFANILDELIIAKDGAGNFYLPAEDFNNMPPLRRGAGYLIKVREEVELVWNVP